MTEILKKAKKSEVVQRIVAPKNKFWNIARWVGIGMTGVSLGIERAHVGPDWLQGIASAVVYIGITLFGAAQMTKK